MSEFNTITDRELRELFREKILADDGEDVFTDQLIDMEATFVFGAPALIPVPTGFEKEFLAKAGMKASAKVAGKLGMKWIFTSLSCATIATGVVVYKNNQPKQPDNGASAALMSAAVPKETPATTFVADTVKTPIPAGTPTDVTKQAPEQLSPLPGISDLLPPESRIMTAGTVALVSTTISTRTTITTGPVEPVWPLEPQGPTYCMNVPPGYEEDDRGADEHDSTYNLDKSFSGVKIVEVVSQFGDINVQPSQNSEVRLIGLVEVVRKSEKAPQFSISYEQTGTVLKVTVRQTEKRIHTINDEQNSMLNFEVPAGTTLVLKASEGNISFNDLEGGSCTAESGFGDIRGSNCRSIITANATSGTVDLSLITGNINATSSFGDVILSEITGNIRAHAASGNFIGNLFKGNCDIQSEFGDITVHNSIGILDLKAESGNIYIDSLNAPSCTINSNFGDVTLSSVTARTTLKIESGDIKVTALTGDLDLESSFGNVIVNNMSGALQLEVNSGNISVTRYNGNMAIISHFGNVVLNETRGNSSIAANSGNVSGKNMDITDSLAVNVSFGNSNIKLKNNYNDLGFNLDTSFGKVKINKGSMKLEQENGAIVVEKPGAQVRGSASSGNITFD